MNKFAEALKVLESTYGIEACLKAANEVYSSLYKSEESFTLADMLAVNDSDYSKEIRNELHGLVAESLAIAAGAYTKPSREDFECKYFYDDRSALEQFNDLANQLLDEGIRFVYLCNYKGEEAGIMLEDLSSNLQIYISKYNYK